MANFPDRGPTGSYFLDNKSESSRSLSRQFCKTGPVPGQTSNFVKLDLAEKSLVSHHPIANPVGDGMKSDRLVIGAVLFLAAGLGLLFGFCNGTTGLNLAYPFSGTNVHVDITTTGIPALAGLPLVAAGGLLLFIALIAAIISQFRRPESHHAPELPAKRQAPFQEFED
jgi:hypothetical protein